MAQLDSATTQPKNADASKAAGSSVIPKMRKLARQTLRVVKYDGNGKNAGAFDLGIVYDDRSAPKADDEMLLGLRKSTSARLAASDVAITGTGLRVVMTGARLSIEPAALGFFRKSTPQRVREALEAIAAFAGSGAKTSITVDIAEDVEVPDTA